MTTSIRLNVAPIGDQDPPRCYLGGTEHDIPVIEFGDYPTDVAMSLGNHADPIAYLRKFAAELSDFADVVEQAQGVAS